MHGGQVNDSVSGRRMRGEGNIADLIKQQFKIHTKKSGLNLERFEFNTELFQRPQIQLRLF
jgi:hypothetical protein